MKLVNKTILITGGSTGVGFWLSKLLSMQHNRVIMTGKVAKCLQEAQREIVNSEIITTDIARPDDIDRLFNELQRKNLVVDVLFNNAGAIEVWDILKTNLTAEDIFSGLAANLAGPVAITNHFIRQADTSRENYIINTTTQAAIMPIPILPLFSCSKGGLSVFTRILRIHLKSAPFQVIEIMPPALQTTLPSDALRERDDHFNPAGFAASVIAQIERGNLCYAPGIQAKLMLLLQRLMPGTGLKIIDSMTRKRLQHNMQ